MKILEYGDFARLPEGTIFSYYFPKVEARQRTAIQRDILPHTEGLYVKGKTQNADPARYLETTYNFTEASLLPDVSETAEQLKDDPDLRYLWKDEGAEINDTEGWSMEDEPHYYVVYEEEDLQRLKTAIDDASRALKEATASSS